MLISLEIVVIIMKIRVEHSKMIEAKSTLNNKSVELNNEIDKLINNLELLKSVWQGEDATIYYQKMTNYFNKLKEMAKAYQDMSNYLEKVDKRYVEVDNSMKNNIQMVGK